MPPASREGLIVKNLSSVWGGIFASTYVDVIGAKGVV